MSPSREKSNPAAAKISPREIGYRMPAEWETHRATWLSWPHNRETWPDLQRVQNIWVEMTRALVAGEKVCLLVQDQEEEMEAERKLKVGGVALERVSMHRIPTIDAWIRDYGPTFLVRKEGSERLACNDWIFNAWGGKYESYIQDDRVAAEIAAFLGIPLFKPGLVLEGGSIDVNGLGTCLTTEQCLLNPNRNAHLNRDDLERILREHLGVRHVIWLGEGIAGDDTDGHIDDIARFVGPRTVVCALEEDPQDENYARLKENYERLKSATDREGRFEVVVLPSPGRIFYQGARLPASYANFYIANAAVLVPTYDHPNDSVALEMLGEIFPDRAVIGIPCIPMVMGLGAIHCVTQQEPLP